MRTTCPASVTEMERRRKISESMKQLLKNRPDLIEIRKTRCFSGKTHTQETREKLSKASQKREQKKKENGWQVAPETREKIRQALTGRTRTEETKEKIRQANKGRRISEKQKEQISTALKIYFKTNKNPFEGKQHTNDTKRKISRALKGKYKREKASNWRGGINALPYAADWDTHLKCEIKERDQNTCQNPGCKKAHAILDVHHIDYNKQNNKKTNLITLCKRCHGETQHNRDFWRTYYERTMKNLKKGEK